MFSEENKLYCPKCHNHPELVTKDQYHCLDCSKGDYEELIPGCRECGEYCPDIEEEGELCEGCKEVLMGRQFG